MAIDLMGKTALVTGGNRGIGAAAVLHLAAAGCAVSYTARTSVGPEGKGITRIVADVTDHAAMAGVMARGYDIVVNNAGIITPIGRIDTVDPGAWAQNIAVNLVGAFGVVQGAIAARGGAVTIINLSSGAARHPMEGWSAYCAGKAGLAMLTRAAHAEFAAQGLRIFGFAPGVVDTGMQATIRASGINPVSQLPRENLAAVDGPAQGIVWLCDAAADCYLGQEVDVRDPEFRAAAGLI
jgi:NAD(P)-dependent dehydrogenase (short-subunit alcohol dehydrogenase family)